MLFAVILSLRSTCRERLNVGCLHSFMLIPKTRQIPPSFPHEAGQAGRQQRSADSALIQRRKTTGYTLLM